jgi:hypothetical protein
LKKVFAVLSVQKRVCYPFGHAGSTKLSRKNVIFSLLKKERKKEIKKEGKKERKKETKKERKKEKEDGYPFYFNISWIRDFN